jgi:hypothetical protein
MHDLSTHGQRAKSTTPALDSDTTLFIEPINRNLEVALRELATSGLIRSADVCNVLMTHAGVKPTFLIVQSSEEGCQVIWESIRASTGQTLYLEVHRDPETSQYYLVGCRSNEKREFIQELSTKFCYPILGSDIAVEISPDARYHRDLGVFLDVPDCCLVERPVMPDEADAIFRDMREGVDSGRISRDVHYSPHLPCSCDCQETAVIGSAYRAWIEENCPDFADEFRKDRDAKPLYLY